MKYYALFPYEATRIYTNPYRVEKYTDYLEKPIEMINARYGILKTDNKASNTYIRKQTGYINNAFVDAKQVLEGPIHYSDMWDFYNPRIGVSDNTKEEYLYYVIDIETGNVLCKTFKHDAKKFITLGFAQQETVEEEFIEKRMNKEVFREKRIVTYYRSGKSVIRSWKKLEIKAVS